MGDWRELGGFLYVPKAKLDEIEQQCSTTEEGLKGVLEYWWRTDPHPSWRRLICALEWMKEKQVLDSVKQNAEPLRG